MNTLIEQQAEAWRLARGYAKCITQDDDGTWNANTVDKKPIPDNCGGGWLSCDGGWETLYEGEINGWDWRDTLQSREEFEAMSQENEKWMPEVGEECEYSWNGYYWHKGVYHGKTQRGMVILERDGGPVDLVGAYYFRPIQTQSDKVREEQIEALFQNIYDIDSVDMREIASGLYSKGVRVITPDERICKPLSDEQIDRLCKAGIDGGHGYVIAYAIKAVQRELGLIEV